MKVRRIQRQGKFPRSWTIFQVNVSIFSLVAICMDRYQVNSVLCICFVFLGVFVLIFLFEFVYAWWTDIRWTLWIYQFCIWGGFALKRKHFSAICNGWLMHLGWIKVKNYKEGKFKRLLHFAHQNICWGLTYLLRYQTEIFVEISNWNICWDIKLKYLLYKNEKRGKVQTILLYRRLLWFR